MWAECPADTVTTEESGVLRQASHYRGERLWYPGSLGQQPAVYLRRCEIVCDEVASIEAMQRDPDARRLA